MEPVWAAAVTALVALVVRRMELRRRDRLDPVESGASVIAQMAGAMEDVLAPLREDLDNVRRDLAMAMLEISELRSVIENAGLVAPPRRVRPGL